MQHHDVEISIRTYKQVSNTTSNTIHHIQSGYNYISAADDSDSPSPPGRVKIHLEQSSHTSDTSRVS